VVPADNQRITRLLTDLDNKDFSRRVQARLDLLSLGMTAEPGLRRALEGKPSPEVRRSVEQLLRELEGSPLLRPIRALEVLETIGTTQARELLRTLAKGAAEARFTQEAEASLERLEKRSVGRRGEFP